MPGESRTDRGKCPVVRWRDVGHEGVMTFMAPLLAENRPFLMSGYWTHQVLCKDAAQRWRTFAGIKSVLSGHGLDQLSESRLGEGGYTARGTKSDVKWRRHVFCWLRTEQTFCSVTLGWIVYGWRLFGTVVEAFTEHNPQPR